MASFIQSMEKLGKKDLSIQDILLTVLPLLSTSNSKNSSSELLRLASSLCLSNTAKPYLTNAAAKDVNDGAWSSQESKTPSYDEVLSSAQLVFKAAKAKISKAEAKAEAIDAAKLAKAVSTLIGAATLYGKLDEKKYGKYVNKAGEYLNKYGCTGLAKTDQSMDSVLESTPRSRTADSSTSKGQTKERQRTSADECPVCAAECRACAREAMAKQQQWGSSP